MGITIIQGHHKTPGFADINIVIDVIRAFTVAHMAFINGVKGIYMTHSVEEAFQLQRERPECLLAGEVRGLPIEHFDLDNSPARLMQFNLDDKYLIQKTTNGVKAALHSMNAKDVFVTGFSNARTTAEYIKSSLLVDNSDVTIQLIASHPTGDDDLACADYIASILEDRMIPVCDIIDRIKQSEAAQKFYDDHQPEFPVQDMQVCTQEIASDFVMKVKCNENVPMITKHQIDINNIM